jgi:hypothetical protein
MNNDLKRKKLLSSSRHPSGKPDTFDTFTSLLQKFPTFGLPKSL